MNAIPLVYGCSGCSSAGQLTNELLKRLDRSGLAEMGCATGLGGDVPSHVRLAGSGRPVIVLDGCPLHCALNCVAKHVGEDFLHIDLSEIGLKKRFLDDPTAEEIDKAWHEVVLPAVHSLQPTDRNDP